jgi:hypothetical protein
MRVHHPPQAKARQTSQSTGGVILSEAKNPLFSLLQ